jgi:hypothetical protein
MNIKNVKKVALTKGLNKELYGIHEKEFNIPIRYKVEEVSVDSGYNKPFVVKTSRGDVIAEFDTEERAKTWASYWNIHNKTLYPK